MRLTSAIKNFEHHLTIPAHKQLSVGTLAQILTDAASYLEVTKEQLAEELFGQAIAGPKRLAFGDFASLATAEGGSAG